MTAHGAYLMLRAAGLGKRRVRERGVLAALSGLLLALASAAAFGQAGARALVATTLGNAPATLADFVEILEDPGGALTIGDVQTPVLAQQFRTPPAISGLVRLGFTDSVYWVRLHLKNPGALPLDQLLEIANARLTSISYYGPHNDGQTAPIEVGLALPYGNAPYKHHHYVFPLVLPAHSEATVFLRIASRSPMDIPAYLWNRQDFQSYERQDYLANATLLGMVIAMLLFNLFLWASLRDGNYLLYSAFITVQSLSIFSTNGIAREFLWNDAPQWNLIALPSLILLANALLLLFSRRMLTVRSVAPRLDAAMYGLVWTCALMPLGLPFAFPGFIQLTIGLTGLTHILIIIASVVCIGRGQRSARLFFLASVTLLVATLLRIVGISGINSISYMHGTGIPTAIQMLLLAFALADRFKEVRAEKDAAQRASLEAQQQLVETLRNSERLLESRVSERTAELSSAVEELKQTQGELVEAEKLASLGSLVAGVAHELNTPIGIALTTASTLEHDSNTFRQEVENGAVKRAHFTEFLKKNAEMGSLLVRSCDRAANLVSSFKQVAMDQTSELRRKFDLRELVDDNLSSLRPSLKHITWTIETDIAPGITCDSFPGPLGQVLVNLIQNAGIHAFDGLEGGRLQITARLDGDLVELVVADDGKGMTAETMAHVFDPFFTTRLGQGGSGLGLAICQNIVSAVLGGSLKVSSQLGAGSRFIARFPRLAPVSEKH